MRRRRGCFVTAAKQPASLLCGAAEAEAKAKLLLCVKRLPGDRLGAGHDASV